MPRLDVDRRRYVEFVEALYEKIMDPYSAPKGLRCLMDFKDIKLITEYCELLKDESTRVKKKGKAPQWISNSYTPFDPLQQAKKRKRLLTIYKD